MNIDAPSSQQSAAMLAGNRMRSSHAAFHRQSRTTRVRIERSLLTSGSGVRIVEATVTRVMKLSVKIRQRKIGRFWSIWKKRKGGRSSRREGKSLM